MRWINKLSPKELLELHKSVVYDDTDGIEGIYRDIESNHINIDFNENWPYEDGTPSYVPTNYRYYDFDYEDCDTSGEPNNGAYRTWLAKRFGKEYIDDLLHRKLDVDTEALKNWEREGMKINVESYSITDLTQKEFNLIYAALCHFSTRNSEYLDLLNKLATVTRKECEHNE